MNRRAVLLTVVLCLLGLTLAFADNPNMGTWKLNEAKSKIPTGAPKNNTVVYEAAGDQIKVTVDGQDGKGNPLHTEWTGKFDGKDYPVTGDATTDMRSYKEINERTLEITNKKDGKEVARGHVEVAKDGKTRTLKTEGMDAAGKKVHSMSFYDKQ
jgi:hypothetical protein